METLIFKELPNGNLQIKATNEGRWLIQDKKELFDYESVWLDLLENTSCNGSYCWLNPEHIAALTDAPIITDESNFDDDGRVESIGKVWWFPDYMVIDELEKLANGETIEFQNADNA